MEDHCRNAFLHACLAAAPADAGRFLTDLDRTVTEVVAPSAAAVDRDAAHPAEAIEALNAIGALGVQIPRRHGGRGYDNGVAAAVVERVARGCASTAAVLMFHYQVVNRTLAFGAGQRRDDDLAAYAAGALAASAWTEPNTTKNKENLRTRLTDPGTGPVVDGLKTFCTGLRSASTVHVLLTAELDDEVGPTFVRVDMKDPAVEITDIYPMLGLRGTGTGSLRLTSVPVDRADLLGPPGSARELMAANHRTPLNPGLLALGIAATAFDSARSLCAGAVPDVPGRYGSPAVRTTLAETSIRVESAYAYAATMVREMSVAPQRAQSCASRLKAHATVTAQDVTQRLLAATGSRGFLAAHPFERHFRDAQATALMGPTNELCLDRVAAELLPTDAQQPGGAP